MYFSTHLLAGTTAGALLSRVGVHPGAALVAGLVSHAALDCVPHHDYHTAKSGTIDLLAGLALVICLGKVLEAKAIGLAALGGVLPDLEVVLHHGLDRLGVASGRGVFPSHSGMLPHRNLRLPWGFAVQLVVAGLCLASLALFY